MKNNLSETDNEIYTIAAAHAICKVDSDYWFILNCTPDSGQ